jgi:Lar family restriction alleviation protein
MTNTPMTEQIAPCPFCGGASGTDVIPGRFYAGCHNLDCDAVGPSKDTEAEAFAAWNRLAAALKLAKAMNDWLRKVEEALGPHGNDCGVLYTIKSEKITAGMIRDAAPPAEKEDGND